MSSTASVYLFSAMRLFLSSLRANTRILTSSCVSLSFILFLMALPPFHYRFYCFLHFNRQQIPAQIYVFAYKSPKRADFSRGCKRTLISSPAGLVKCVFAHSASSENRGIPIRNPDLSSSEYLCMPSNGMYRRNQASPQSIAITGIR